MHVIPEYNYLINNGITIYNASDNVYLNTILYNIHTHIRKHTHMHNRVLKQKIAKSARIEMHLCYNLLHSESY